MSLVVISKEDTEKMLDTINNKFGEVKNKQLDATSFINYFFLNCVVLKVLIILEKCSEKLI